MEKVNISILVPYKKQNTQFFVYMQMRSEKQKLPKHFGFFGGHQENNESPLETLKREINEELNFQLPDNTFTLFNRYEFLRSYKHIFLFEPEQDWEQKIEILEGEYGKWLNIQEALELENIILEDKVVLHDVEKALIAKDLDLQQKSFH